MHVPYMHCTHVPHECYSFPLHMYTYMYMAGAHIDVHACPIQVNIHMSYACVHMYMHVPCTCTRTCTCTCTSHTHVQYTYKSICTYTCTSTCTHMSHTSLVPRPSLGGGGEGGKAWYVLFAHTATLISRHSGNSVLRTDNVFKRHYRLLSRLSLGSLREREYNQYKRSHSLSSVFTTCLWNTGKSTLSRVFSPEPRIDGSLPDLTEGFCRFHSD